MIVSTISTTCDEYSLDFVRHNRRMSTLNWSETLKSNAKLSKSSKQKSNSSTLLKSNYKYKRRCASSSSSTTKAVLPLVTEMHTDEKIALNTCRPRSHLKNKSDNDNDAKKSKFTFNAILHLFIAAIGQVIKLMMAATQLPSPPAPPPFSTPSSTTPIATSCSAFGRKIIDEDVGVDDVDCDRQKPPTAAAAARVVVVVVDSDEINYQRNYDKVSRQQYQSSMRCHRHRQWPMPHQWRHFAFNSWLLLPLHLSTTLSTLLFTNAFDFAAFAVAVAATASALYSSIVSRLAASCAKRAKTLSILLGLLIALTLSASSVEAGACWQTTLDTGKCNEIYSLNITKSECCRASQEFSYTNRELSSVEYFFATAIGGGMECAPCLENCKNVKCGANKKCVKRKGRPKCICAPECGAAIRRRQRENRYRSSHNKEHHIGDDDEQSEPVLLLGKSPRDIRSLSSEITNINLGLDGAAMMHHQNQNQNQRRKIIIMQSHSHKKPEMNKNESKCKRLLINANVERSDKPTTRRIQILSNVNIHANGGARGSGARGGGGARSGGGGGKRRNKNVDDDNGDDDFTRSASVETQRGSYMSRHKSSTNNAGNKNNGSNKNNNNNNNKKKNKNMNKLEVAKNQEVKNENHRNNNNNSSSSNDNTSNARVRHIHQNVRHVEHAPNHDERRKHHERHQQFQHKRKQHHNRSKPKQLPQDHHNSNSNSNNNTSTRTLTTTTTATTTMPLMVVATTSSILSAAPTSFLASTSSALAASTLQQISTTPVNSTTSGDHRLLNHGSNSAKSLSSLSSSSSSASSASSASSSSGTATAIAAAAVSVREGVLQNRAGGSNLVNSDDLTFLDGIYDKFNLHGFPNQQLQQQQQHQIAVMHYESAHNTNPVCGTDGRTYNTECQLRKRACRTDNPNLLVAYRGHCRTTCNGVKCLNGLTCVEDHYMIPHCIACRIECPQDERNNVIDQSRAVCGVDGKTYKSTCDINRMICKIGRSIAVAYPGPCLADRVTCNDISCGPKHTCLVDLLTHEPRCVSCRYKCSRKRRPASLRFEEGKLCGANSRTYNSWCEMRKDSCSTGFFIDVKMPGECP